MRRKLIRWIASLAVVTLSGEIGLRAAGVLDFPLYLKSDEFGYIPAPAQQGKFVRMNEWAYNELSMGTKKQFSVTKAYNVLLLGDSVVNGGNPTKQEHRLFSRLGEIIDGDVWPVSAGSWSLENQLSWICSNLDVARRMDDIVFVINSGDFHGMTQWTSEIETPTRKPVSAIVYTMRKYLIGERHVSQEGRSHHSSEGKNWRSRLTSLARETVPRMNFVLYPTRQELSDEVIEGRLIQNFAKTVREFPSIRIIELLDDSRWRGPELYRDNIHPSIHGTRVLAHIIASSLHPTHR